MYQAMIRENREVIPRHFLLTMGIEGDYPPPAPGQFVMLRVTMGTDPLLRRPFSVHRFRKKGEACYSPFCIVLLGGERRC